MGTEKENPKAEAEKANTGAKASTSADENVTPISEKKKPNWEEKAEQYKKDYLYLKAEFETHKRNAIKERADLLKYGSERVLIDLISVLDIFDQALTTDVKPENLKSFVDGIKMTQSEFQKALEKSGAVALEALGQPFDPALHEALTSEETADMAPGCVLRVFKKGYKLHDRVIRPAQVVVAKEKGEK